MKLTFIFRDAEKHLKKILAAKVKRLGREFKKLSKDLLATKMSYDAVQEGIEGNEKLVSGLLVQSRTIIKTPKWAQYNGGMLLEEVVHYDD